MGLDDASQAVVRKHEPAQAQLKAAQIRQIYSQSPLGAMGALIGSAVLTWALWDLASHTLLIAWLSSYAIYHVLRQGLVWAFRVARPPENALARWGRWHVVSTAVGGLFWGAAAVFLFPSDSLLYQFLLAFFVTGIAAAGAVVYSPTSDYLLTVLAELVPLSGRFFYEPP